MDGVTQSLMNIRTLKDGSIDLSTVDSRARSLAGAVAHMHDMDEAKKLSMRELQQAYFSLLESDLSELNTMMITKGGNPHTIGDFVKGEKEFVETFSKNQDEFFQKYKGFWLDNEIVIDAHLQERSEFRAVFSGDLFPSYTYNIASGVGLYMDTIVLPCPALKVCRLIQTGMKLDLALYYFVKHGLNALKYKNLALADVNPPIVIIAPNQCDLNDMQLDLVSAFSKADILSHAQSMFGTNFDSTEKLQEFLQTLKKPQDVVTKLAKPEKLLFDTNWKEPLEVQMEKSVEQLGQFSVKIPNTVGLSVMNAIFGRMTQANDAVMLSRRYGGVPLLDVDTSWQYLQWKFEYDQERSSAQNPESPVLSKALAGMSSDLDSLFQIPSEALIELRKEGLMQEMRGVLTEGLDLMEQNTIGVDESMRRIEMNFKDALSSQHAKVKELIKRKAKFAGINVSTWLATGGLSIAAASTGYLSLQTAAAVMGAIGTPSALDVISKWNEMRKAEKKSKKAPMAILHKHIMKKL